VLAGGGVLRNGEMEGEEMVIRISEGGNGMLTIIAYEIIPLFITRLGLVPKLAGFQTTRSASLPTSTLPVSLVSIHGLYHTFHPCP
jgi:hypothetical protein